MALAMNSLALIVFGGLFGLLGATYAGIRRLRRTEERSTADRLFRLGFPISAAGLLLGVVILLALIGRFEPYTVFGTAVELSLVRRIGGTLVVFGLLGCMGLLVVVGIGPELESDTSRVD